MTDTQMQATTIDRPHRLLNSRFAYTHFAGMTLVLTYVLMLLDAYTSAIGAGLSCPDWPTC